jgi:hypothetical protein
MHTKNDGFETRNLVEDQCRNRFVDVFVGADSGEPVFPAAIYSFHLDRWENLAMDEVLVEIDQERWGQGVVSVQVRMPFDLF